MSVPVSAKAIVHMNGATLKTICKEKDGGLGLYLGQIINGEHSFRCYGRAPNYIEAQKWADGIPADIVPDCVVMGTA